MNGESLWRLSDFRGVARRLESVGFSPAVALEKGKRFAQVADVLRRRTVRAAAPAAAWFVPGRIEVFGKHTDYAGGRSVVAAAERGFCGVAVEREDARLHVIDIVADLEIEFPLGTECVPGEPSWGNYPATVVRRMAANFASVRHGATIAFASDLPPAAGMSSSSALMVMTFLLLGDLNHVARDPAYIENIRSLEDLAGYLGTVENGQTFKQLTGDRGVGTFGGSEDHTAILCARPGQCAQFSYCPVRRERTIPIPTDHQFVIGVSGVVAEKTGAARDLYNRASSRAAALARIWQQATQRTESHLAAIVRSSPEAPERMRALLEQPCHGEFSRDELIDRYEQFVEESEVIIPALPDVVDDHSLARWGELARRSQQLASEKLGNQIPEMVFLADSAMKLGAVAASAHGAGFGGSVWALAREQDAKALVTRWSQAYRREFPEAASRADFFVTHPGPPATPVILDRMDGTDPSRTVRSNSSYLSPGDTQS